MMSIDGQLVCPCPTCPERIRHACTVWEQRHCEAWNAWWGTPETEDEKTEDAK